MTKLKLTSSPGLRDPDGTMKSRQVLTSLDVYFRSLVQFLEMQYDIRLRQESERL